MDVFCGHNPYCAVLVDCAAVWSKLVENGWTTVLVPSPVRASHCCVHVCVRVVGCTCCRSCTVVGGGCCSGLHFLDHGHVQDTVLGGTGSKFKFIALSRHGACQLSGQLRPACLVGYSHCCCLLVMGRLRPGCACRWEGLRQEAAAPDVRRGRARCGQVPPAGAAWAVDP